jgi:hypothetical protein
MLKIPLLLFYGTKGKPMGTGEARKLGTWAKALGFLCLSGALTFVVIPSAQAVETPSDLYVCKPKAKHIAPPPSPPKLPTKVEAQLPATIEDNEFKRVCPVGEVPYSTIPTGQMLPSKLPPKGARSTSRGIKAQATASREQRPSGAWYSWATGRQTGLSAAKGYNGIWAWQTNERPYIPYEESMAGSHSLAQLWGVREYGGCTSYAEIGWTESAGQFNGNTEPHLFIAGNDCGQSLGYMSVGNPNWVQSSAVVWPGAVVTYNDKFHAYGARMDGNNWWFYYDGQWVGYIKHAAWTKLFPGYLTRGEAGGEVATNNKWTCADMGYGALLGTHPWAAMFSDVWYEYNYQTQVELAKLSPHSSDPNNYVTGNWYEGVPGAEFRYGGPGWC